MLGLRKSWNTSIMKCWLCPFLLFRIYNIFSLIWLILFDTNRRSIVVKNSTKSDFYVRLFQGLDIRPFHSLPMWPYLWYPIYLNSSLKRSRSLSISMFKKIDGIRIHSNVCMLWWTTDQWHLTLNKKPLNLQLTRVTFVGLNIAYQSHYCKMEEEENITNKRQIM